MNYKESTFPKHPGTYAILFNCKSPFEATVGRLGRFIFPTGYWVYVGSAYGPGGLRSRLNHHLKPSVRPHWHLDYVKKEMRPVEIWTTMGTVKREHDWARTLTLLKGAFCPFSNFGSTDCNCRSHLIHLLKKPRFSNFQSVIHHSYGDHALLYRTVVNNKTE